MAELRRHSDVPDPPDESSASDPGDQTARPGQDRGAGQDGGRGRGPDSDPAARGDRPSRQPPAPGADRPGRVPPPPSPAESRRARAESRPKPPPSPAEIKRAKAEARAQQAPRDRSPSSWSRIPGSPARPSASPPPSRWRGSRTDSRSAPPPERPGRSDQRGRNGGTDAPGTGQARRDTPPADRSTAPPGESGRAPLPEHLRHWSPGNPDDVAALRELGYLRRDPPPRDADPGPADADRDGDARTSSEVRQGDRTGGPAETKEEIDAKLADFTGQTGDAIAEAPGPADGDSPAAPDPADARREAAEAKLEDDGDSPSARADRPGESGETGDDPATPDEPASGDHPTQTDNPDYAEVWRRMDDRLSAVEKDREADKRRISDLEGQVGDLSDEVKAKDQKIAELEAKVADQGRDLSDFKREVVDRFADIRREFAAKLEGFKTQIENLVKKLTPDRPGKDAPASENSDIANLRDRADIEPSKVAKLAGQKVREKFRKKSVDVAINATTAMSAYMALGPKYAAYTVAAATATAPAVRAIIDWVRAGKEVWDANRPER